MAHERIAVRRIAGACGAEVSGVDLTQPLDEATVGEIRRAIVEHGCLFFRDQPGMTDHDQARFAQYFGKFGKEPFVEGEETHPNVIAVVKEADEGGKPNFGGTWHSDDRSKKRVWNGMLTILIDPKRLGTGDAFATETTAFLASLRKSPVAPGFDKVRIAGEPEREMRTRRSRDGIPVDDNTWNDILAAMIEVRNNHGWSA